MMASEDSFVGPVNLGNSEEYTILEIAQKIKELTGARSCFEHRVLPEDDPTQRKPDNSLAKIKLDWQPRVSLDMGLANTITYFKKKLEI